jgi:uncharacterized protein YndB with AHSA1/START domain
MATQAGADTKSTDRVLVVTRAFDAPRSVVFKAWTDPKHLVHWWGPRGYVSTVLKMDLRPGGTCRIHMKSPEGKDNWSQNVYREIVEPERIVLTGSWTDSEGNPIGPESTTTVTFEEQAGKTKVTLHQAVFESDAAREAHRGGWTSSFDRLADYLASR